MYPVPAHSKISKASSNRVASGAGLFLSPGRSSKDRPYAAKRVRFTAIALFMILPIIIDFARADSRDALREHLVSLEEHPFLTEAVFKNGLKVLVNENRAYPVVAIEAVVRRCTPVFPALRTGPENLLAAMFFRREKAAEEGTVEENARLIGALLSASVDFGSCRFEIQAPAPQWKRALRLHSRAVLDSAYDASQIKAAAARLESEVSYEMESPSVSSLAGLLDLAFNPGRGVAQPVISEGEGRKAPSAETLSKLHSEMFSPGGMILVISGDIDSIEVLGEAAALYGGWAPGAPQRQVKLGQETQSAFRYRRSEGNLSHPRILFGFHVPGPESPDFSAIEILNAVMGIGRGSVLQSRIQSRKKLILRGTTRLVSGPGSAYWIVDTTVPFENVDRSEIDILVELELLKRKSLDDAELERARAQLERTYREEIQTVSGRAASLAQF